MNKTVFDKTVWQWFVWHSLPIVSD